MNQMQVKYDGWVIVNANDFIMEWSFKFSRTEAIAEFVKGSQYTWKQWYRMGCRCMRATKTIAIA